MAKPEFSESTYAFAITHNIVAQLPAGTGVPIFPTRWAEGQPEGGYDVEIPRRSVPLFLQYKVPAVLSRVSNLLPPGFDCPYYRIYLRTGRPNQHEALLNHEAKGRSVFYAAPRFHEGERLNRYFGAGEMLTHSRFFRPSDIGTLDADEHHVAYHPHLGEWWIFSEPSPREVDTSVDALIESVDRDLDKAEDQDPVEFLQQLALELLQTAERVHRYVPFTEPEFPLGPTPLLALARRASILSRVVLGAELVVLGRPETVELDRAPHDR